MYLCWVKLEYPLYFWVWKEYVWAEHGFFQKVGLDRVFFGGYLRFLEASWWFHDGFRFLWIQKSLVLGLNIKAQVDTTKMKRNDKYLRYFVYNFDSGENKTCACV